MAHEAHLTQVDNLLDHGPKPPILVDAPKDGREDQESDPAAEHEEVVDREGEVAHLRHWDGDEPGSGHGRYLGKRVAK